MEPIKLKLLTMKLYAKSLIMSFLAIGVMGCDLEDPIESTVTQYAEFEVTGGPYLYVESRK